MHLDPNSATCKVMSKGPTILLMYSARYSGKCIHGSSKEYPFCQDSRLKTRVSLFLRNRGGIRARTKKEEMEMASTIEAASSVKSVAVVGGGVSGLAAAYKLKSQGLNVTVFEAEERAGGQLRSVSREGLIWDEGANTMTESDVEVTRLLDNLGLREKQQFPISQHKGYIVRNGAPQLVPTNPIALMRSSFLSTKSKFQIILEPFLWRSSEKKNNSSNSKTSDEYVGSSVREFFQRHFGDEVVDYLIDPFVGTSAGDPDSLSMPHAFPELWNLEKKFGSIIVGVVQSKFLGKREKKKAETSSEKRKQKRGSFSFQGGMQRLTDVLSEDLEDNLKLCSKVLSLSYNYDDVSPSCNWSVSYTTDFKDPMPSQSFDAIIMTAPLCNVKEMNITKRGNPFVLGFIPDVSYLPVSVLITTFKKENVSRPLEGLGVFVPSKEQQNGLKTLGTLFSSMMFPDRAPSDTYLYTTFVGGSRNRDLAKASKDELKRIVTSDLRKLLGVEGEPTSVNHFYWNKAFPLYGHNYGSVLEAINKMEENLPGFFYAGNHKGGISVGKAITSGCKAADLVLAYLNSSYDDEKVT